MKLLGTKATRTTSYHPQSDRLVERFHRNLKDALRARLHGPHWINELPWVLLGIRSAPQEDLGASSRELVYGTLLAVPGDFLPTPREQQQPDQVVDRLRKTVGRLQPVPTSSHGSTKSYIPPALKSTTFVFIRRDAVHKPLQPLYDGPYKVLQHGEKFFRIQLGSREETVSIDRLKPAHQGLWQTVLPAVPPSRGRPRRS
jgi:hypothetical protein